MHFGMNWPKSKVSFTADEQSTAPMTYTSADPDSDFLSSLASFCRKLKERGVKTTLDQEIDCCRCLQLIDITRYADFYAAVKTGLLSRAEDRAVFDEIFFSHWGRLTPDEGEQCSSTEESPGRHPGSDKESAPGKDGKEPCPSELQNNSSAEEAEPAERKEAAAYSALELLKTKDFSYCTDEDLEEIRKAVSLIAQKMRIRESRRKKELNAKQMLDLRRTMRKAVRYGGSPLKLMWKSRDLSRTRMIILCDVSGSMERYSRFLVQFLYGLQKSVDTIETFVFSTRLSRISGALRRGRTFDQALHNVSRSVVDWSGGTRIGDCLAAFNRSYAPMLFSRKSIVLVISDGWDRGDAGILRKEMSKLRKNAYHLIWLSPLLGSPQYKPSCIGMKTALPFLDQFLPFYNLESLGRLGDLIHQI